MNRHGARILTIISIFSVIWLTSCDNPREAGRNIQNALRNAGESISEAGRKVSEGAKDFGHGLSRNSYSNSAGKAGSDIREFAEGLTQKR